MNSENGKIGFSLALDDSELKRQIASAMNEFGRMGDSFEEEGDRMDAVISKIAKGLSGIAAGWSIKEFTTKVAQVRGEFQQLEIAFGTMLGSSSKANELMNQLTRTAVITPFDLQGVAQGAKQLLAYGTQAEEVNETLTRLGDIAAGLSIPLGDLVYLYGTTMTQGRLFTQDLRQFMGRGIPLAEELAAQFGVTKDKVGEFVTAGKVGAEEVKQAIWSMTNEGSKFGGLMEKQSASITGQISNIEDAVDSMFNEIGKQSEGAINTALSGVSYLVENYKKVGAILASIATAYGTYKAAVIAVNVAQKANIAILRQAVIEKRLAATASVTLGNAEAVAAAKGKLLAIAQKQIVTSIKGMGAMLTNPYVLLAAAVGAAVYGIYKLATAESAQEQAAKTLNNRLEELAESQQKYNDETEEAIRLAEDDSAATIDRDEALQLLIARYPDIIQKYIDEKGHLRDILGLKKEIAEADGHRQRQEKTETLRQTGLNAWGNYNNAKRLITAQGRRGGMTQSEKSLADQLRTQYKEATGKSTTEMLTVSLTDIRDYYKSLAASSRKSYNRNLTENKITDFTKEGGKLESYSDSQLKDLQKTLQNYSAKRYDKTSAYISQLDDYLTASDRQSLLARVNAMISARGETKGTSSGWVSEAKKKWQDAEKAYNDYISNKGNNVSQATFEAKAKELKQAAEDAKKAYESLGGSTKSAGGSQSASDKRIKAAEDAANKEKELELSNQQERLKLQQDGTQKELDEIKLSYDKKKAEIEKQAADLAKANKEAGTKGLNANGLTAGQQTTINEANQLNMQQMSKSIEDLYKEPLSRYQDYTGKRLAIEKKFNDDIALLEQARLNASESGNSEQLAKIERAIAQAKAEKTKELLSNDLDILKESPEYVRAFEDLKNTSSDTLTYLVEELERLKGTAAASLDPKDLREYTDAIQSIMDELDSRDPFKALADRQKELVNANARVALAKKNLDAVNSGKSVNKTKTNADGSKETTDEYLTAAEALAEYNEAAEALAEYNKVAEALAEYNKAKDEAAKASNRYSKAEKEALDSMRNYLKEYGSFEQQRLAVTEEYEEKIAKATTEGEKLSLQKERDQKLGAMQYDSISSGIDWRSLFIGVGTLSKDMMQPMMDKLVAYTKTDDYLKADSQTQQDVANLIQELRQYLGSDQSVTWETLGTATDNFMNAVARYNQAVESEKSAIQELEQAESDLKNKEINKDEYNAIKAEVDSLGEATAKAKNEMEDYATKLNDASEQVANFTSSLTAALNNAKGWANVSGFSEVKQSIAQIDSFKGALDSVLPTLSEGLGQTIGKGLSSSIGDGLSTISSGLSSALSSGLGQMVGFLAQIPQLIMSLVSSIKSFVTGILNTITEIISLRWIDDLVNSILDAVGNLINAIFDLPENLFHVLESIVVDGVGGLLNTVVGRIANIVSFGALSSDGPASWFTNSNAKKVAETIENLTDENKKLEQSIQDLTDAMEGTRGAEAIDISSKAADLQRQTDENYLAIAQAQAGYHNAHHSWNYYWDGYSQEEIDSLSAQIGRSWNGDIWDLSPEEMKRLRSNIELWEKITDTGKGDYGERVAEKLNDYIEQAGKLEEITDALYENLTTTTSDNVFDDFLNSLYDLADGSEDVFSDISDAWQEMVNKMVVNNLIGANFQKKLETWYEDLAKLNESKTNGELTDSAYKAKLETLKSQYEGWVKDAQSEIDLLRNEGIITSTSEYSQEASDKGFQTMSQDAADELNGRFTAIQMDSSAIRSLVQQITANSNVGSTTMTAINSSTAVIRDNIEEMRNLSLIGIDHLETISKNTHELYEMNDRLAKIEKNTRQI